MIREGTPPELHALLREGIGRHIVERPRAALAPMPHSLSVLLAATSDAERERAWRAFVEEFSRLLLHVARSVTHSYDDGMDAYAHLLEQLLADDCRRLRKYAESGRSKFTTWLVVVARRICLDHHRLRFGRSREHEQEATQQDREFRRRLQALIAEDVDASTLIAQPNHDAEQWLRASELHGALVSAIATLPPSDQLLLKLRFEDDLSGRQIADLMHLPSPFHVYRHLNELSVTLRALLLAKGVVSAVP